MPEEVPEPVIQPTSETLQGWKEIASHLRVTPRTAQTWEKKFKLPIRRLGGERGPVHLRLTDLEQWTDQRTEASQKPQQREEVQIPKFTSAARPALPRWVWLVGASAGLIALVSLS